MSKPKYKKYKVLLDTKYVGKHTTVIEATDYADALKKAKRLENEYNEVKAITLV